MIDLEFFLNFVNARKYLPTPMVEMWLPVAPISLLTTIASISFIPIVRVELLVSVSFFSI